jgi:hypothetical protein
MRDEIDAAVSPRSRRHSAPGAYPSRTSLAGAVRVVVASRRISNAAVAPKSLIRADSLPFVREGSFAKDAREAGPDTRPL